MKEMAEGNPVGWQKRATCRLGMRTIQFQDAKQLERDLRALGVEL